MTADERYNARNETILAAHERMKADYAKIAALSGPERLATAVSYYDGLTAVKRATNCGNFRECDTELNDASRELIAEFRLAHGKAFLVKLNRYTDAEKAKPAVWEWDGGLVYNFGASAVLPCFDAELERLLLEREAANTHVGDLARASAIYARIVELGGTPLFWS